MKLDGQIGLANEYSIAIIFAYLTNFSLLFNTTTDLFWKIDILYQG